MKKDTITLRCNQILWFATFSDPSVKEVCGTDTLPTPYRATTPGRIVQEGIQARNPGSLVVLGAT